MVKKSTLGTLINKADHDCQAAGNRVGQYQQAKQQADEQLNTLKSYKDEYSAQLENRTREGISPALLKNYQAFMGQLSDTIGHQKQTVEQHTSRLAKGIADWIEEKRTHQSYSHLQERQLADEQAQAKKLDQKLCDEMASQHFHRKGSDADSSGGDTA